MVVRTRRKLPGVDVTGATIALGTAGLALYVALQDMPMPEKVTLLSLLAFVIGSCVWLLRGIGGRLVDSIDANTKTVASLVAELHTLTQQNAAFQESTNEKHAEYAREREKAVAEVKEAIRDAMRGRGK